MKKRIQKQRRPRQGNALLNEVIRLTGIPAKAMRRELNTLLEKKNLDVKNLTLEQLRMVAAAYLREIMGNLPDPDPKRLRH
ncbi:hypothetical protein K2X33_11280 [bacterium]|nr:hypothetical protein [bacterium]